MVTYRNDRSGETITTDLTEQEIAARFAQHFAGKPNWLWFWLAKAVNNLPQPGSPTAVKQEQVSKALAFLGDNFLLAVGYGLKRPMIRCHFRGQRFKFYLSAKGTVCLKTGHLAPDPSSADTSDMMLLKRKPTKWTHDPVGDEEYIGCLLGGKFLPQREWNNSDRWYSPRANRTGPERKLTDTEAEFLRRLEEAPVKFLAECSKDMGRCCYCNLPLEDPISKALGYGKVCSTRWGLPYNNASYVEKAPSFSKIYCDEIAALFQAVRQAPKDATTWLVLADRLEDAGLPRLRLTESGLPKSDRVTMPRA